MGQPKNIYQEKKEQVLKEALNQGFVMFFYRKSDGTMRKAIGTRNVEIVMRISSWKPTGAKENTGALCYFDLVRLAWRSMSHGSLSEIAVAEFGKGEFEIERYILSQSYAARAAINECMENGTFGNIPHLVDILAGNYVWQANDQLFLGHMRPVRERLGYHAKYEDLKFRYNKLVDDYARLVERHNEAAAENAKIVTIFENVEKLIDNGDEPYQLYPVIRCIPEKEK